jgi:hypothetical protein
MISYNVASWTLVENRHVSTTGTLRIEKKSVSYIIASDDQPGQKPQEIVLPYRKILDIWVGTQKFPSEFNLISGDRKWDDKSFTLASRLVTLHVTFHTTHEAESALNEIQRGVISEGKVVELQEDKPDALLAKLSKKNDELEKRVLLLEKHVKFLLTLTRSSKTTTT